jgi:hypothetical protein
MRLTMFFSFLAISNNLFFFITLVTRTREHFNTNNEHKNKKLLRTHTHIQTKNGPNIGFKEQYYLKALPGCDSYKAPIASAKHQTDRVLAPITKTESGAGIRAGAGFSHSQCPGYIHNMVKTGPKTEFLILRATLNKGPRRRVQ